MTVFAPEILVSWNAITQSIPRPLSFLSKLNLISPNYLLANGIRGGGGAEAGQAELIGRDDEMLMFYKVKKST